MLTSIRDNQNRVGSEVEVSVVSGCRHCYILRNILTPGGTVIKRVIKGGSVVPISTLEPREHACLAPLETSQMLPYSDASTCMSNTGVPCSASDKYNGGLAVSLLCAEYFTI